jgi:alpha-D-ribose 1-methylphosphonate 5-triphosphate synthase subunit PhnH
MTAQPITFHPQARQTQATFREALECLARPGRIGVIGGAPFPVRAQSPAYGLLLTLADHEVTIAVPGAPDPVARHVSLGTGSRLVDLTDAAYVLCGADPGAALAEVRRGTLEVPEAGATVIISVESLVTGSAWRLRGPGIAGERTLFVTGLSATTLAARDEACSEYPKGIDLFLVDSGGRIAGIPRTTQVSMEAD